ncbi:hypothetical protein M758_3G195100 [Ceratodon purpureus]|nr:hypothetical protein M758_3G195100 [Ceratodon purpureus]
MWSHRYQAGGYEVGSEMPAWLFLTVAGGLFTGLLLAMLIGFYLIENNAGKYCVHKKQQQQQQQQQQSCTGVSESAQLCCVCGNVRNRKGQATKSSGLTEAVKPEGTIQPLVDGACGKLISSALRLWYLGSQSSQRPGIVKSLQESWLNARSFFKKVGKGETNFFKGGACPFPADSTIRSENVSAESPVSASVDEPGSGSKTTITTTITTTTSSQSSTAPESCGVLSSCDEKEPIKQLSQKRLVLEILMSSSGGEMPRATGVRLKMETNTCLDNLTNIAASPGGDDQTPQKRDDISTDSSSTSCGPIPSRKTSSCTSNCHSGSTTREPKSLCHVSKQGVNLREDGAVVTASQAVDASVHGAEVNGKAAGGSSDELECFDVRATGGTTRCGSVNNKMTTSGATTSTFSFSANATKSKVNSHCTSTSKSKSKGGCQPQQCSRLSSALPTATACSVNFAGQSLGTCKAPAGYQSLNNLSLDGLGSLRISLLDAGVKGKSVKECSKGVTADIASALAALNVDSIVGKGVSMGAGTTLGAMMTEPGKVGSSSGSCSKHSYDISLDEEIVGEGSGSEQGTNEGEEQQHIRLNRGQVRDEDFADEKKEKKKKKHRGRRHKGKPTSALGTGCPSTDTRESDKLSTDHCGTHSMVTSTEVELGCLCGTAKGGYHSSSCPYPFTCSGSMVQRKIKEQYDELVRSNAARTLTLAQVGRFTTCLVEAKLALQQKSETIQRRFIIAKSLLAKADKSSFDRLCGQIYGLENEQKKLEEDTVVYNRLQEQLKLSPAYLKMLEYGRAHFELQPNTGQLIEKIDSDVEELSFEELLAQEKKDSFWQKHGPARPFVQVS